MTDRELLELAAKAAGIEGHWHECRPTGNIALYCGPRVGWWNPLTDDAEALRLAVRLRLDILFFDTDEPWVEIFGIDANAEELFGDDPYAATRRAIVRAAAEIERAKRPLDQVHQMLQDEAEEAKP
jgi:hypothetical protein